MGQGGGKVSAILAELTDWKSKGELLKNRRLELGVALLAVAWLIATAPALSFSPALYAGAALAPALIWGVVRSSWFRAVLVVAAGMVILGSDNGVGIQKIAYAGLLTVCTGIAVWRLVRDPPTWSSEFKPLIVPGVVLGALLMLGALLSPDNAGAAVTLRQGLYYFILLAAPILALDAARALPSGWVAPFIGVLGAVAAVGFAADWLNRRGVSNLPFSRYVLSSLVLPGFAFALSLERLSSTRRVLKGVAWLLIGVLIPVAMLVTGTRTNLIIFVAALGLALGLRPNRVSVRRLILSLIALALVGVSVFPFVAGISVSDPQFISQRLTDLANVLSGATKTDQSYELRNQQYRVAAALIAQHPWLGLGLSWLPDQTFDTPLLTIVRIGGLGLSALVVYLCVLGLICVRVVRRYGQRSGIYVAGRGAALVILANIPFGTPLEDRGFGFALLLFLIAFCVQVREWYEGAGTGNTSTTRVRQRSRVQNLPRISREDRLAN